MRVAHVLHGWPAEEMGGTGLYVSALARALASMGHEVAIVHPSASETPPIQIDQGLSVHGLHVRKPRRWRDTWDGDVSRWTAWCRRWVPDVVHFHHLSGLPLGVIEATPCRRVLTLHDYAIPCARGQLVTATLTPCTGPTSDACTRCLGPALAGGRILATAGRILGRMPGLYKWARQKVRPPNISRHEDVTARIASAQRAIQAAHCVLSPSHDLAARMVAMGFHDVKHTELPLVQEIDRSPQPKEGPVRFLYASSVIPTKGPDRLVRAFRALDGDARLTIAGHAPDFPTHPGFADAVKADAAADPRVTWLGPIPPQEMSALLQRHDVLVLPSIWPENSPLIVREATRAGLSVIASAQGGARELAPDGSFVGSENDLLQSLKEAVSAGRIRHTSAEWPSPRAHAEVLLHGPYISDGRGALECATLQPIPGTRSEA